MGRPTIYSIAEELNISASTVSRAFSRPEKVRAEVRERILEAARRTNYQPHPSARHLATGRHGMVGVVMPDITNPFFPPLLRSIQEAAHELGLQMLFADSGESAANELRLLSELRNQVDTAVIASPRTRADKLVAALGDLPAITINRTVPGIGAVVCDDADATFAAGSHLRALGHQKVALLEGPKNSWVARHRATAARQMATRLGLELLCLGSFPSTFEGGLQAAPRLAGSGASAVLAFDDVTASGLIAGLSAMGMRVPADMSVIGCDDAPLASMLTPQLTTLRAPFQEMGTAAMGLAGPRRADTAEPSIRRLSSALVVRGTTGPA